jgi:sigma-B regulation protein RsbQ
VPLQGNYLERVLRGVLLLASLALFLLYGVDTLGKLPPYVRSLLTGFSEALAGELSGSFCSTDPVVAKAFAMATFFSDHRHVLADAQHPSLILQSRWDNLAPPEVGRYMQAHMLDSSLEMLEVEGHCPHMSHPGLVVEALQGFLAERRHS